MSFPAVHTMYRELLRIVEYREFHKYVEELAICIYSGYMELSVKTRQSIIMCTHTHTSIHVCTSASAMLKAKVYMRFERPVNATLPSK